MITETERCVVVPLLLEIHNALESHAGGEWTMKICRGLFDKYIKENRWRLFQRLGIIQLLWPQCA